MDGCADSGLGCAEVLHVPVSILVAIFCHAAEVADEAYHVCEQLPGGIAITLFGVDGRQDAGGPGRQDAAALFITVSMGGAYGAWVGWRYDGHGVDGRQGAKGKGIDFFGAPEVCSII
jgi:hypothetical protein